MARRRRKSSGRKILVGFVALVLIGVIGYSFFVDPDLTQTTSPLNLETILGGAFFDSSTDTFSLPAPTLGLLQIPTSDIDCFTKFTLVAKNTAGQTLTVQQSSANTSPIFIFFDLFTQGATSELAKIGSYELTPKMRCDNKSVDGGAIGYNIPFGSQFFFTVKIRDSSGSFVTVGTFASPKFSHGDLHDNFERFFPKITIPASTIDARANQVNFRYNSAVSFVMSGEITLGSIPAGVTYKYFTGQNTVVQTQHLVTVDKVPTVCPAGQTGTPPNCTNIVVQNQEIEITEIKRKSDGADVMGNWNNKINVLSDNTDEATISVRVFLRDFREANSNEISPEVQLKSSVSPFTAQTSKVFMTQVAGTGTFKDFFDRDIQIPLGVKAGTYAVEVTSRDRTQTAQRGFQVIEQSTTVTCPAPNMVVNGICVKPTLPPDGEVCPSGTSGVFPNCVDNTTMTCEQQGQVGVFPDCQDENTIPPTNGGTTGNIGTAFIRYSSSLTDPTGGGGGGGCPLSGKVPQTALPIVGLQLLGLGTCDGLRFGSVELTPTLDFGTDVKSIIIDSNSILLQQDLFLAKNNPYPASPVVNCSTPTTSDIGICNVENHVFLNDGTGNIKIAPNEVTFVRNFVDKDTNGEYQIAKVKFIENTLIDKIQRNGVALADGDEVSLMYLIWGIFSGTNNGEPFIASIPAMTFVQSFTFQTGIGGATCDAPSVRVKFNNDGTVNATGVEEGRCVPCPEIEEIGVASAGTCEVEMCPAGTEGVFPQCTIIDTCNFPNRSVGGECLPPLDDTCPITGQIRDPFTLQCREPIACNVDPICTATERFQTTDQFDDCGGKILICVSTTPTTKEPCPSPNTQFRDSLGMCVTLNPEGCGEGESRNSLGICEKTGVLSCPAGFTGIYPNCVPDGNNPNPVNFCQLGAEGFNLSQCLASIFGTGTGDPLMITGTTQTALVVVVMLAILLIVVAVIIKRRRGGFGS